MKLFGKDLFNHDKRPETLYDFAQHGILDMPTYGLNYAYISNGIFTSTATTSATSPSIVIAQPVDSKPEKEEEKKDKKTPKELYDAKALNNNEFKFRIDDIYLREQIDLINDKLELILGKKKKPKMSGGELYGVEELESMLTRLKNRRKAKQFQRIIDTYPHTTNEQIALVLKDHKNLDYKTSTEFIPDMPKEAIKAMKEYNDMCIELCKQKTNFYVLADKKDFEIKNKRRDPILLAQSPFGFFWQILGAWDKEMIYLGDL